MEWTYYATHVLWDIAKEAYQRSASHKTEVGPDHDAVIAIVFAVFTLEAWMSQTVHSAKMFALAHPRIALFADFLEELDSKAVGTSLKMKFYMSHWFLCEKKLDRGAEPYQSFALLVDLRNALAHLKPDKADSKNKVDNLLLQLRNKGLVSDSLPNNPRTLWVFYVSNPLVAKWACNTAAAMIQHFWKYASEEKVKVFLKIHANALSYSPLD